MFPNAFGVRKIKGLADQAKSGCQPQIAVLALIKSRVPQTP